MFVKSNKLSDLKNYFYKKLELHFSQSEMKFMFYTILENRLYVPKQQLYFDQEYKLSESDLLHVRTIAHKLLENEPFQYLVGKTEFFDIQLKCDSRALIPRPETEELVEYIRYSFAKKQQDLHFFDFCTGTGCIALALKNLFPDSTVQASDVSNLALDLAKENAKLNNLNVQFFLHDLLKDDCTFLEQNSLDCIVSNPPYIPEGDKQEMNKNVLNFEPHLALFVSNDEPLIFYEIISKIAIQKLKVGGMLFFEIHEKFAQDLITLMEAFDFKEIEIKKDLQGKDRMLKAIK